MGRRQRTRRLRHQAMQLERALASHKVRARVSGGTVSPRVIRFHVLPAPGTTIRAIARLTDELALALGVESVRVSRRRGRIDVEVPRRTPRLVHLRPLLSSMPAVPRSAALLGVDEDGTPLLLRLASPEVSHVLIAGTTGSGKTALARTMIASLAATHGVQQLGLVLIDPQGRGYGPFSDLPHLAREPAIAPAEAAGTLQWLVEVMVGRDRAALAMPQLVCFIDELGDLIMSGGKTVQANVTRLVQRGRTAGVHVVACTQKPTAALIGTLARSNFPVRIVGRVTSPEDAKLAAGIKQTGAERLLGRGDFLLIGGGEVQRFQAAYASVADIAYIVDAARGEMGSAHVQTSVGLRREVG
jgi:S-DNA-T family DNA segregation ATPase FtsK/SpoIIIE